jgi:type VI secretion system protein VasG
VVKIDEPEEDKALLMMRSLASNLEQHHRVQILDEALDAAVRLSHRYIPERQLPDKAVSLTDTACARVAVSQHAVPPELEDCRRRIQALETELEIIGRETATEKLEEERKRLADIEDRWSKEKELVDSILVIRAKLRGFGEGTIEQSKTAEDETHEVEKKSDEAAETDTGEVVQESAKDSEAADTVDREESLKQLKSLQQQLSDLQGERPLILPCVDAQAVGSVVADWTGIPVGGMVKNEIEAVLNLADRLKLRVIGQDHALEAIAKRITTSRARIENPNKPIAVMFLVGPSGVGKTETALALAEAMYGGENNLITINMSEFQVPGGPYCLNAQGFASRICRLR